MTRVPSLLVHLVPSVVVSLGVAVAPSGSGRLAAAPSADRPAVQAPALEPDAARQPRASLGGEALAFRITSRVLGETRTIAVATPASFDRTGPDRRYPVIVVLDGESLLAPVAAMASVLSAAGQMPEAVIVGIENTRRLHDLTPPGLSVSGSSLNEGGGEFLDFIARELLPAVDARFRGGAPRVLAGHSSGGILATWAAATRDTFPFVLALDTPTHLGDWWLTTRLLERARARRAPLRYVSLEAKFGWTDDRWAALVAAAPGDWRLDRERLAGESHESMTTMGAYVGLRRLFADASALTAPEAPAARVLAYYDGLAAPYGAPVVPPRTLLRRVIEDLIAEGHGALARDALDRLVAGYGEPADARALRDRIAGAAAQPPPAETVEGLLATPFPPVAAVTPFLGEWRGESWSRPEARSSMALRLRVEAGRVAGEVVSWPAAGIEQVSPLQYLAVTPGGLAFGYLNGMRPRGVLLYEGRVSGDVMDGEMRLAGMTFTMPDGRPLPVVSFRLLRQR
ncbi:MAG: alpha/beta hydrolase-fold protein [Vicinamibacterales bacterium]